MSRIYAVVAIAVAIVLSGCASSKIGTRGGWEDIPREEVWVCLTNLTPYTLRGKIIEEGKLFSAVQIRKVILADSNIAVRLIRDRKYRIEGEGFDVRGKRTGRFIQFFATTNLKVGPKGKVQLEPVVISGADFYSSGAPPLFGFIINTRPDSLTISVWHPQRPGVKWSLKYGEYTYLTIVAQPRIIWIQEYYSPSGQLLKTEKIDWDPDPRLRGRVFHDGRKLDFRWEAF